MTHIPFYPTIWQSVPYGAYKPNQAQLNASLPKKELVLVNKRLVEKGVSEMTFNVTGLSAIDENGNQHLIAEFKSESVNLKGMHTGLYTKTKEGLNLEEGQYKAIRWHFDTQEPLSFVYNTKAEATFADVEYLDFEIVNGLTTKAGETYDATFRFDLVPFITINYLNVFKGFFNRQSGFTKALSRSFGSF